MKPATPRDMLAQLQPLGEIAKTCGKLRYARTTAMPRPMRCPRRYRANLRQTAVCPVGSSATRATQLRSLRHAWQIAIASLPRLGLQICGKLRYSRAPAITSPPDAITKSAANRGVPGRPLPIDASSVTSVSSLCISVYIPSRGRLRYARTPASPPSLSVNLR